MFVSLYVRRGIRRDRSAGVYPVILKWLGSFGEVSMHSVDRYESMTITGYPLTTRGLV